MQLTTITNDRAQEILAEIRKTHDTTKLAANEFENLVQAILFYGRGRSVSDAARVVIEEIF